MVAPKCFDFGISEIATKIDILEDDQPARTQILKKRSEGMRWIIKMREKESCIYKVEVRANIFIVCSDVEQLELDIADALRIGFAASNVELGLIDVGADSRAAWTLLV